MSSIINNDADTGIIKYPSLSKNLQDTTKKPLSGPRGIPNEKPILRSAHMLAVQRIQQVNSKALLTVEQLLSDLGQIIH